MSLRILSSICSEYAICFQSLRISGPDTMYLSILVFSFRSMLNMRSSSFSSSLRSSSLESFSDFGKSSFLFLSSSHLSYFLVIMFANFLSPLVMTHILMLCLDNCEQIRSALESRRSLNA